MFYDYSFLEIANPVALEPFCHALVDPREVADDSHHQCSSDIQGKVTQMDECIHSLSKSTTPPTSSYQRGEIATFLCKSLLECGGRLLDCMLLATFHVCVFVLGPFF